MPLILLILLLLLYLEIKKNKIVFRIKINFDITLCLTAEELTHHIIMYTAWNTRSNSYQISDFTTTKQRQTIRKQSVRYMSPNSDFSETENEKYKLYKFCKNSVNPKQTENNLNGKHSSSMKTQTLLPVNANQWPIIQCPKFQARTAHKEDVNLKQQLKLKKTLKLKSQHTRRAKTVCFKPQTKWSPLSHQI